MWHWCYWFLLNQEDYRLLERLEFRPYEIVRSSLWWSGKTRGAAAIVKSQYPRALYLHCASHCLNLAVVKSLEVSSIRNMMGILGWVYVYFNAHPKRQRILEKSIDDTQPGSAVHKSKDLCRTRWVQQLDALNLFQSLYPSIVACVYAQMAQLSGLQIQWLMPELFC